MIWWSAMASLGFMLGVISPHFVVVRSIFSLICIWNVLCIYIVVVTIRYKDSKMFSISLESVSDRPEAFSSSSSLFPNFPVENVNLWSETASTGKINRFFLDDYMTSIRLGGVFTIWEQLNLKWTLSKKFLDPPLQVPTQLLANSSTTLSSLSLPPSSLG